MRHVDIYVIELDALYNKAIVAPSGRSRRRSRGSGNSLAPVTAQSAALFRHASPVSRIVWTWNLRLPGKNLSDAAVIVFGGYGGLGPGHQGMVNPGREISLTATFDF